MPAEARVPAGRQPRTKNGARELGAAVNMHVSVTGQRALLGKWLRFRAEIGKNRLIIVILTSVLLYGRWEYNSPNKNSRTIVTRVIFDVQLYATCDNCVLFYTFVNFGDVQM